MHFDWSELAATAARTEYNVRRGEVGYGETEPREARPCCCESPGLVLDLDADEVRCWKCGACPTDPAASRS